MGVRYATREQVKAAADWSLTTQDAAIDRQIEAASREVERLLHRHFYPLTATYRYPWPNPAQNSAVTLYVEADLLAVTTLVADTTTIVAADYFLEPNRLGPPYRRIDIDQASTASFESADHAARSIAITGRWGYSEDTEAAGELAEADDGTETALDVTDSSLIGVGDLILIGTEQLSVTGKALLTTGTTLNDTLAALNSDVLVTVASGAAIKQGEVITLDAERMLVESISGNDLTVKRAFDGSVLAAHSTGITVYAPRTLTVERARAGTTAATHASAAAIVRNVPPQLITDFCIALVLSGRGQEKSSYSLTVGQGDGEQEARGLSVRHLAKRVEDIYLRTRGPAAV